MRARIAGRAFRGLVLSLACLAVGGPCSVSGQESPSVEERLQRLEAQNQELAEQNRALMERYAELMSRHEAILRRLDVPKDAEAAPAREARPSGNATDSLRPPAPILPPPEPRRPVGLESGAETAEAVSDSGGSGSTRGGAELEIRSAAEGPQAEAAASEDEAIGAFVAGYDSGFVIRSTDEDRFPYELKINGRMQFRHFGFARSERFWFDSAGNRREISNTNLFEVERGRLEFSGFFVSPRLQYFLNFNFDSDSSDFVDMRDFWMNYRFSDAFILYVGKAFVPGSREWIDGTVRTQFADRSLATTFFRPDRSVGIWAIGEVFDGVFYRAMIADGFNTSGSPPDELDDNFVFSGSTWWDVFDNYGQPYSDLEWHRDLALRIGNSYTGGRSEGLGPINQPTDEQNFVRLSDGTRLTLPGALAPGVTVNEFVINLYAIDAALKYRGFSLGGEYYLRWLRDIQGNGPIPIDRRSLFDTGFYAQAGYFLIPERLEAIAKTSQIWGEFGSGSEYAGGFTWFFKGNHLLKLTFDVTRIIGSPAQNSGPNYRAGDTGVMFRTQLQAAF